MSERKIYLEDVPLERARERFWQAIAEALTRSPRVEEVPLAAALDRVTSRPVFARLSSPHYHACAMDGIAVHAARTRGALETAPLELRIDAEAFWVDTGDPLPAGTDAVIMVEEVEMRAAGRVAIRAAVPPYHHVRQLGEDVVATEAVVPASRQLAAPDLAALASAGITHVPVVARPLVAVITTGDELVDPATDRPPKGAIIDSNRVLLDALVRTYGGSTKLYPAVADDVATLRTVCADALATCDVVVFNAGSSAGSEDFTAQIIGEFGAVAVHGVAIRPGHPVVLGVSNAATGMKPLLGIPGYPVSAAICADLFLRPLVEALGRRSAADAREIEVTLTRKLFSPLGEEEYVRAVAARVDGRVVATPLRRGAGIITSLSRANCIVVVPRHSEGAQAGERLRARALRSTSAVERTLLAVGSHDVAVDLLAGALAAHSLELVSANVGSIAGLTALAARATHVAGTHVLDVATGTYNSAAVARYVPGERVALVLFAQRDQGLIVAPGNPLHLHSLRDVAAKRARYVNRQKDAGTRMLLDAQLAREGLEAGDLEGYDRLEFTHLAVAALVADGSADCGLGILAAARALHCDFIPLAREPYELALLAGSLEDARIATLIATLREEPLRREIERLGGYDASQAGVIRFVPAQ